MMTSSYLLLSPRTQKQASVDRATTHAREEQCRSRNVAAMALAEGQYQPRKVPSAKAYTRKAKHPRMED